MRHRISFAVIVLAMAAVGVAGWLGWWRDHDSLKSLVFTRRRLAFVETENGRLQAKITSQQLEADAATARSDRADIEKVVTSLRELQFLRPVIYREIPRAELPAILRQKLGQQVPDQEFDHTAVAFAALGLIPKGLDLKKTYLALLGEQVGAFYDQHSRELFTFSGQSLASSQNRVIMAHELTHALEDQHFHLERLPLEAKSNDDRALAASALVEGDATLVMNRYMIGTLTGETVRDSLAATMTTDVRQLAIAPRFLRETLLFPYLKGQEFCLVLYERGGWNELARAFERPPASTSQILHPERFFATPREEPVAVDLGEVAILSSQPIADNVLGEFGLRQWLFTRLKDDQQATEIAGGWRGDRYIVYGDAQMASDVWESVWRTAAQAEAFAQVASVAPQWQTKAMSLSSATSHATVGVASGSPDHAPLSLVTMDSTHLRVRVINAQDIHWFDALKSRFTNGFKEISIPESSKP